MDTKYSVRRSSKRAKVTITIERDRTVVVHAPSHASDEAIARVVEAKRQWIYEKRRNRQKYTRRPHPPGKELVSGESVLYLGRRYRIEVVEGEAACVRFDQRFLVPASRGSRKKGAMREWYIARAKKKILPRVVERARELGVSFGHARIVDNRYRWGSCTVRDNINLNWRLIKAPMFVIDYVIAHELAHLLEPNHTPRFWSIVKTQAPAMEKARGWLKEHGELLEEEV
ncbi:MAG: SprT family zinc-dependent metalloprotease [Acidobacteria bacterium]|nr:SprT family zinc-dependent metalloprotease [Acidobacteriota bacterium]